MLRTDNNLFSLIVVAIIWFGFCAMIIGIAFAEAWVERKRIEKEGEAEK